MPLNDTNTTIVTASQDFSESYLWAKETFALCSLLEKGGLYHKPGTKEILETLNPVDEHIIIQELSNGKYWVEEPDEYWVRATAYTLLAKGTPLNQIQVLAIGGSLLEYTQDDEKINQIGLMLLPTESLVSPRSFTDWEGDLIHNLSPREAAKIAHLIIAVLEPCDRIQANIALDLVRKRAGMSEYTWDKKYVTEIRASLERTLLKSSQIIEIEKIIDRLIKLEFTGSALTKVLNVIAQEYKYPIIELRKIHQERLGEVDTEVERTDNHSQVKELLKKVDAQLELSDYLPDDLATPLKQWCEWLNIRETVALTALLAGASSLHKTGTELVLHRNQNFRVPSTIYSAIVSPSGQKKSPIFNNIVRQPLNQLEKEKQDAYQAALEDYEVALEQWEEDKKGKKPEKPKDPTLYYFTNATGEAIPVQASKDPKKALLALIDELSGYFNSSNAYRNGRGSDKQDLLSYFDGSGQTILRASGVKVNVKSLYLSIFGTIQPEILKQYMEDCSDPDGNWARFLFVNQPLQASVLHDDDGMAIQISDRITQFYRQIDRLPEMEYHLSREAFKRYQGVYKQLEQLRVTHAHSGMAAVYSKMEGYIGRLALNLHVLWELAAGKDCPSEEIPLHIMEMAIQLARFYMGQVKVIHANSDDDSLPSHILKMIELSKRLEANGKSGWLKAKQVQETFSKKKRPPAQTVRDWMKEAVNIGYGQTRNTGNRLEYHWRKDNGDNDPDSDSPPDLGNSRKLGEQLGNSVHQVETTNYQGVEDNLGNEENTPSNHSPSFEEKELPPENSGNDLAQSDLEGGEVSQPSPTLTQEQESQEIESVSAVEDNLGNDSPTIPQVPQMCDSSPECFSDRLRQATQLNMKDYWEEDALAYVKRMLQQQGRLDHHYQAMLPYGLAEFSSTFEVVRFGFPERDYRLVTIHSYEPILSRR